MHPGSVSAGCKAIGRKFGKENSSGADETPVLVNAEVESNEKTSITLENRKLWARSIQKFRSACGKNANSFEIIHIVWEGQKICRKWSKLEKVSPPTFARWRAAQSAPCTGVYLQMVWKKSEVIYLNVVSHSVGYAVTGGSATKSPLANRRHMAENVNLEAFWSDA